MTQTAEPFFEREPTKRAIRVLATSESLALFLGAGVSAESGIPPWQGLIEQVVARVAERLAVPLEERATFVQALIQQHGFLTAAAISQSVLGHHSTLEAVRTGLYERVGFDPQPGFHAMTVAQLVVQRLADGQAAVPVVTTNYDRLIEKAIDVVLGDYRTERGAAADGLRAVTVVSDKEAVPQDSVPVYHIHGCVAPRLDSELESSFIGRGDNTIVLGERDYARLQHGSGHWQDDKVHEVLSSGCTSVFTGMSLADPNMIRYLTMPTDPAAGGARYAVLSAQSERRWVGQMNPHVALRYAEAVRRRLNSLRVKPVQADFYIQVSQFLSEVLLYQVRKDDWSEDLWYGARLDRWRSEMDGALTARDRPTFEATQRSLSKELQRVVDEEVLGVLERDGIEVPRQERLALELWLRNNRSGSRSLELWGSSVSTWATYDDLAKPLLDFDTTYTAVEAFMRDGHQFRRNGRTGSRWQYQLCQVVRLQEEPWFNLPVAVVVLSSNRQAADSSLATLTEEGKVQLQRLVLETGAQLADPMTVAAALTGA